MKMYFIDLISLTLPVLVHSKSIRYIKHTVFQKTDENKNISPTARPAEGQKV